MPKITRRAAREETPKRALRAKTKIPGDEMTKNPVRLNNESLPDASGFDAKKIKRAVLTNEGWLVPG